jgi:hypothetical protein
MGLLSITGGRRANSEESSRLPPFARSIKFTARKLCFRKGEREGGNPCLPAVFRVRKKSGEPGEGAAAGCFGENAKVGSLQRLRLPFLNRLLA